MAENLQDLCWWHEKYMPGEILYQLYKYHPQARVHISSSKVALCEKINQKPTSSPQLSCIRSIEAEWCLGEYDEPIKPNASAHYPAQLKTIIYRCQNLESLSLINKGGFRVRSYEVWDGLWAKEKEANINETSLITLEGGNTLPQVKNLRLRGMRLGPLQSELWATQLLWQNIKRLSLISVNWTHLLPKLTREGLFHALEALEAKLPLWNSRNGDHPSNIESLNQFHAFLEKLPPLKMFIGYGFPQETMAVLATHHSKSLNDLRFRCHLGVNTGRGDSSRGEPPVRVSIHNLDNLLSQFQSLHSLGIQFDWTPDEQLPYDLLANIVLQTRIRHLELNLPDLGRCDSAFWPYPGANESACQALIQSLDEISPTLLSIHIVISDWYPFRVQPILQCFREAFVIGERDDTGCMRFRKMRQFNQGGRIMQEGDFVPQVPAWIARGAWPSNLRQDIEGRISDMFCGKMIRDPIRPF